MTPLFFLSYARAGGDDAELVRSFFRDLSTETSLLAGTLAGRDVGFFDDQSLRVGMPWRDTLLSELGTAQTFVALTSPQYFASEWCGREWALFSRRLIDVNSRSSGILPVTWVPSPLPPVAQTIQRVEVPVVGAYRDFGLRQVMRLQRHRDDYRYIVHRLASHIVDLASNLHVPPLRGMPDLDAVPSVFVDSAAARPAGIDRLNTRPTRPILNMYPDATDAPVERD
jgi:hypothetical protein